MQNHFSARLAAAAACAAFAAIALAGCAHDETPPPTTVVTQPPVAPAPSTTTTTVVPADSAGATSPMGAPDTKVNTNAGPGTSNGTDTALSDAVNTAIVHNKQMTGARVEVVATAGVVTLNGQVQNQQQKALAGTTATKTPGVSSVKNKLIVVTTGGAKPKPMVVTKIKTVTKTKVVHDGAPSPAPDAGADTAPADGSQPPAPPAGPTTPATPDSGTTP